VLGSSNDIIGLNFPGSRVIPGGLYIRSHDVCHIAFYHAAVTGFACARNFSIRSQYIDWLSYQWLQGSMCKHLVVEKYWACEATKFNVVTCEFIPSTTLFVTGKPIRVHSAITMCSNNHHCWVSCSNRDSSCYHLAHYRIRSSAFYISLVQEPLCCTLVGHFRLRVGEIRTTCS
jgi:hypothetical protein